MNRVTAIALLWAPLTLVSPISHAADLGSDIAAGRDIALDPNRGNCAACHPFSGASRPGNIAPPLIAMRLRFPSKRLLRQQIWDPTVRNSNTVMPPYGIHQILSEDEIDKVTAFVYNL